MDEIGKLELEITRQMRVSFIIPLLHKNLNTFSLDSFQVKMGQILHMSRILQVLWKDKTKLQGTKFHPNAFFKEIGGPSPQIFIHCAILINAILEWKKCDQVL